MTNPRLQSNGLLLASGSGLLAVIALSFVLGAQSAPPLSSGPSGAAESRTADAYGRLPTTFVANEGQVHKRVRFYGQGAGHAFYFTRHNAVLSFTKGKRGMALHLTPLGADPSARLEASGRAPGKVNYMVGSERHTNLSTYREVAYRGLWPGIDLVFRGQGGRLKYEFRLARGADPGRIALAYRGADGLALGATGDLLIRTPRGTLRDARPQSFQVVDGKRVPVASRYELGKGNSSYGFRLGAYDSRRPLVIDPGLEYSTFLGTSGSDESYGIAVDANGSAYVTGETNATDFPVTPGAFDITYGGGCCVRDAFVAKLNPTGSALVYATYLGGSPYGSDTGMAIAVSPSGAAYVTGSTQSGGFPVTDDSVRHAGSDAFVTKLNPSGSSLGYSTLLGGSCFCSSDDRETATDIAIDGAENAYITGLTPSNDFPTTTGAADRTRGGSQDAFVAKYGPGGGLDYSTYLGGADDDAGIGIEVRGSRAYVTGSTRSADFPVTNGVYDGTLGSSEDAFVTKMNPTASGYDYSTYIGGNGSGTEEGHGIAIGDDGSAYVVGRAGSPDFPTTPGAYDSTPAGFDAFVSKLDPAGAALSYSTLLGGNGADGQSGLGMGIAVDAHGSAWVTGQTESFNFPTTPGALDTTFDQGAPDAFVTEVNPTGTSLSYSTYIGGNLPDNGTDAGRDLALAGGKVYVTGETNTPSFPTTPGAYDTVLGGGGSPPNSDAFITVLDDDQDGDGLPDEWETNGLTVGGDFVNLPAMGASPTHKDVFVEIDYMLGPSGHTHNPGQLVIDKIITAFDNSPVTNPDGTTGIHLHVDYGSFAPLKWAPGNWGALSKSNSLTEQANLGTGAGTDASPYDWSAFDTIKSTKFNDAARAQVFHYNVWAHNLSMAMGNTSGISRGVSGGRATTS